MLTPLLPPGLTLDTYEGRAYVGLVPFTMTGVRPVGLPAVPGLSNFHETNVRTYVHREGRDPGVWFFSLDAANSLAVRVARAWYRLPYHFARMDLRREADGWIDYRTERLWPGPIPARCAARYRGVGEPRAAAPGTLEHFLIERYILYAWARERLYTARVYHTPYPVQDAEVAVLEEDLLAAAGIRRGGEEPLKHFAHGVTVDIFPLRAIRGADV
jgi:hypothetical protein